MCVWGGGGLIRVIKILQQDFALKLEGSLCEFAAHYGNYTPKIEIIIKIKSNSIAETVWKVHCLKISS